MKLQLLLGAGLLALAHAQFWVLPRERGSLNQHVTQLMGGGASRAECPPWGDWEESECLWPGSDAAIPASCLAQSTAPLHAFLQMLERRKQPQLPVDELREELELRGSPEMCGHCARKVRCRARLDTAYLPRDDCPLKEVQILPDACPGQDACRLEPVDGECRPPAIAGPRPTGRPQVPLSPARPLPAAGMQAVAQVEQLRRQLAVAMQLQLIQAVILRRQRMAAMMMMAASMRGRRPSFMRPRGPWRHACPFYRLPPTQHSAAHFMMPPSRAGMPPHMMMGRPPMPRQQMMMMPPFQGAQQMMPPPPSMMPPQAYQGSQRMMPPPFMMPPQAFQAPPQPRGMPPLGSYAGYRGAPMYSGMLTTPTAAFHVPSTASARQPQPAGFALQQPGHLLAGLPPPPPGMKYEVEYEYREVPQPPTSRPKVKIPTKEPLATLNSLIASALRAPNTQPGPPAPSAQLIFVNPPAPRRVKRSAIINPMPPAHQLGFKPMKPQQLALRPQNLFAPVQADPGLLFNSVAGASKLSPGPAYINELISMKRAQDAPPAVNQTRGPWQEWNCIKSADQCLCCCGFMVPDEDGKCHKAGDLLLPKELTHVPRTPLEEYEMELEKEKVWERMSGDEEQTPPTSLWLQQSQPSFIEEPSDMNAAPPLPPTGTGKPWVASPPEQMFVPTAAAPDHPDAFFPAISKILKIR